MWKSEITETKVEDQQECGVLGHAVFSPKLLLYSLWENIEIHKDGDGENVTKCPNNTNRPDDGKHPVAGASNPLRLAAGVSPVRDKLRTCAVDEGGAGLRNKPITEIS